MSKKQPVRKPASPLPPPDPEAEQRSIGLRFWIRQVDGSGKVLGEMGVGRVFRSKERIQLVVESNTDGYLAIVQQGADGRSGLLFPPHEGDLGVRRIPAHTKVVLPGQGHSFTFDETAGTERLLLVLMRDRQEFSRLPLRREMGPQDLAEVRRLGSYELGAKNLVIQAFADPQEDPATYVVDRLGHGIVQEIALVHEK